MKKIKLHEIAHARAGDKGEITNISLFPYDEKDYVLLEKLVTAAVVKKHFRRLASGKVIRYCLPEIKGFNFVLHGARRSGVSAAVELDPHGKSFSSVLLELEI